MELSNPNIAIRSGEASDVEIAVDLILIAAESLLVNIFGGGDKLLTKAFLTGAWKIKHSQFGFGQHLVICVDGEIAGLCTHWKKEMPEIFAEHTAKSIVEFYTMTQAQQVIERSKKATHAILVPLESATIVGHVAVLPKYRRLGLATKLISHVEAIAKQDGKSILGLDVENHNLSALRFYEKSGFERDLLGPDRTPFIHMIKHL